MPESNLERHEVQMNNAEFFPHLIALMNEGHTITLGLRGYSMRPFLEDKRDKALLRKATDVVLGEPVLAEVAPGRYVLHRIVKIEGDKVTLRGDGNLNVETCRCEDVKAQVIGFYRKGRSELDRIDGLKWRIYSRIWCALLPVRRYILGVYRRLPKALRV